jgi:hypothetical protein
MGYRERTNTLTLADARRFLGYMRLAVLCVVLVMALAVEFLAHPPLVPLRAPVLYVFYALAAADAVVALVLRRRLTGSATETLRSNPEDATALPGWIRGQIVPLPMALSLGFLGVMARVLGAAPLSAAPFYLLVLVVLFTPGRDEISV